MKLKFDSSLEYQQEAIAAVADLFEGQPAVQGDFEVSLSAGAHAQGMVQTELGIGNALALDPDTLLKNLHAVQDRNTIEKSASLFGQQDEYPFPNFSVEMETGTGKTYVYLRTIFELNQLYGLKKFIIVVPSVAIREGVTSSIGLMRSHFAGLYNNVPFDHFLYDSKDLSKVRQFAGGNEIQIMVINIQAFQKDAGDVEDYSQLTDEELKKLNVIHREQDKMSGRRPIEFVHAANPIVIIDEPQSVDTTPKARQAIKSLNPLLCLRYSATHANPYNLLYRLDPIKAYDLRLVKQIEVASIKADANINEAFIRIDEIGYRGKAKTPSGKVTIFENSPNGTRMKSVNLKAGLDLSMQTNRAGYDGYIVDEIYAEPGNEYVRFANGKTLWPAQEEGGMADEIARLQMRQAVEEHFKKEINFKKQSKDIKVLTLFFIDKVENYRGYDEDGRKVPGKLARWFEQAYEELLVDSRFVDRIQINDLENVHDGYFSVDKKKGKVVGLRDTSGKTKADEETYELIMRDKERLLSMDTPLRFIFSHSALKEGWDNPNVFQICSLREMGTERERRQTIGRGLRLPVNQSGERIYDDAVNKLTVIASESFEEYAGGLQADMEKDMGAGFKFGRIQKIAFSQLVDANTEQAVGQEESAKIWEALKAEGYIDKQGDITTKFNPKEKGFQMALPEEMRHNVSAIVDEMNRYLFSGRVVNARDKQKIKYNKRVELNEDFKTLWDKINQKTRYKVEFSTPELIARALAKIREMPAIKPVPLTIEKTEVEVTRGGVEAGRMVQTPKVRAARSHAVLPDILSFLQRETELTRGTLVEILKQCGRLGEFKLNPQAFMSEVAKQINRALKDLVVDGIKYERLEGQIYEMHLFEQDEIETYLSRLYEVSRQVEGAGSDVVVRTPYDYIEYDSEVEREVAEKLDDADNVRFFCKLPRWFKVPTPLGDYNPDWAVVAEDDGKLYLVRETKSTQDSEKRRATENKKIQCGQAHFDLLDVNFKVAANVQEVVGE